MTLTVSWLFTILSCFLLESFSDAFCPVSTPIIVPFNRRIESIVSLSEWSGDVTNSENGKILGCTITNIGDSLTDWEVKIDGEEADLGKFSSVIYQKLLSDGKQQNYRGFRPGTIPPMILPTYVAYAMDECAKEATLEALAQNEIRPFQDARDNIEINSISIAPPKEKKKKKKKKKKGNETANDDVSSSQTETIDEDSKKQIWSKFDTMQEAIDEGGWKVRLKHVGFFLNLLFVNTPIGKNHIIQLLLSSPLFHNHILRFNTICFSACAVVILSLFSYPILALLIK